VARPFLHRADIVASFAQVRCERAPQHMAVHPRGDSRGAGARLHRSRHRAEKAMVAADDVGVRIGRQAP
jgi:hypothetical protein